MPAEWPRQAVTIRSARALVVLAGGDTTRCGSRCDDSMLEDRGSAWFSTELRWSH